MNSLKKELWPYSVKVHSDNTKDIMPVRLWVDEQFGKVRDRWNVVYFYNYTQFYFKNQRDAAWFALRWA